ncbi:MAG: NAD(P)-binding domain-containing protein [Sedimenticola sp.]
MSSDFVDVITFYLPPLLLLWFFLGIRRRIKSGNNRSIMEEEFEAGLTEPASLHPVIDHGRCMGCGSCVDACPEQVNHPVLGLIDHKAVLIAPTNCIGHSACRLACPFDAITLVFGTERRGVDIPQLDESFQTNMKGIYIAGELGGMGLIRNAIEQGRQAVDVICKSERSSHTAPLDLIIIGAGPAGFSASLCAKSHGLSYQTIEQDSLGGTVFQFPRGKIVMTAPVDLPLIGRMRFTETTKEALLKFWRDVEKKSGIRINYKERVESITPSDAGYIVTTVNSQYEAKNVLLAIGRRGTPRKLGVEGEGLSKVVYRLIDPTQYRKKNVLVVGGGDSALEAATTIAAETGTQVTLSYRSGSFSRAKRKNREKVTQAERDGSLKVLMNSNVSSFKRKHVTIVHDGEHLEIANDAAIICAGGVLPTGFLKGVGIEVETKYGTA